MLGGLSALASPPLRMMPPIYGPEHPTFTDFVAPGIIVTIGFAQAIALTAVAFVMDRKEGLLDRCDRVWGGGGFWLYFLLQEKIYALTNTDNIHNSTHTPPHKHTYTHTERERESTCIYNV